MTKIGKINGTEIRKPLQTFEFAERVVADGATTVSDLSQLDDTLNAKSGSELLLTTLNAYKPLKLYSAIPNDGSADFDFSNSIDIITSAGYPQLNIESAITITQLFARTSRLDLGYWQKSGTGTQTFTIGQVDPIAGTGACEVTQDGTRNVYQARTATPGTTMMWSTWFKKVSTSGSVIINNPWGSNLATIDLATFPSGWVRIYSGYVGTGFTQTSTVVVEAGGNCGVGFKASTTSITFQVYAVNLYAGLDLYDAVENDTNTFPVTFDAGGTAATIIVPAGCSSVITTSGGVDSAPIAVTPGETYTIPEGVYEQIKMI